MPWHYHLPAQKCPWCAIEQPMRTKLFGGIVKIAAAGIADLETLWARYLTLADLGRPRRLPRASEWIRPPDTRRPWIHRLFRILRVSTALFALFAIDLLWPLDLTKSGTEIARQLAENKTQLAVYASIYILIIANRLIARFGRNLPPRVSLLQRWTRWRAANASWHQAKVAWLCQPEQLDIADLRPPIEALKRNLDALAAEREALIRACAAPEPEAEQRSRYLATFRIEAAKLANIGPARCAVLRSWGVDTAADVDPGKISDIPGFGKNLTDKLVIWRDMKEKAFVYNAASIVDPLEVQLIDRQLAARRAKLMRELRERIGEMERRVSPFTRDRAALWVRVEAAFNARMLARLIV
jgi:DNA-binding helix-hairpin-helix protein with protein kinase domain